MPSYKSDRSGHQVAAIPVRRAEDGSLQILLITSRETKRWIVPKGWPMKGLKDYRAAAVEAREEAGVRGRMLREAIGTYTYWRRTDTDYQFSEVVAYVMKVEKQLRKWKEMDQREIRWVSVPDAATFVEEPELGSLILALPSKEDVQALLSGG